MSYFESLGGITIILSKIQQTMWWWSAPRGYMVHTHQIYFIHSGRGRRCRFWMQCSTLWPLVSGCTFLTEQGQVVYVTCDMRTKDTCIGCKLLYIYSWAYPLEACIMHNFGLCAFSPIRFALLHNTYVLCILWNQENRNRSLTRPLIVSLQFVSS